MLRKEYNKKLKAILMLFVIGISLCNGFLANRGSAEKYILQDEIIIVSPNTASMSVSLKWKKSFEFSIFDMEFLDYNYDGNLDLIGSIGYTGQPKDYDGLVCINSYDRSVNWMKKYETNYYDRRISICDIDKDNQQEIIMCADKMYCFDENGNLEWSYSVASYILSFSIVDIDKDGNYDILVNAEEEILILSYLGALRYSRVETSSYASTLAIGNLDESGELEIIHSIFNGNYTCINCYRSNLNLLWSKELVSGYIDYDIRQPIIADIAPSAGKEIIGTTSYGLVCLDSSGNILWGGTSYYNYLDYIPVIADIDNDGQDEIIASSGNDVRCFDFTGIFQWSYEVDTSINYAPVVADLNGDGTSEILLVTNTDYSGTEPENNLYCLNYQGELLWTYNEDFQDIHWLATMDLDFDNKLEIVFVGANNVNTYRSPCTIYCLQVDGIQKSGKTFWNEINGLNYNTGNRDSDGDTIDDLTENIWGSSRLNNDTDSDGINDRIELMTGLNPTVYDSTDDEDSDGLTNIAELSIYHTSIYISDSDFDGLNDFDEVLTYFTNPLNPDTDGDELTDFDEISIHFTDPNNADSDSDLVPDGWEISYGFNPLLNDSYVDDDNDTLLVFEEYLAGSSPFSNDTDGDGLSDPDEYLIYGTNPSNENTDGDLMGDFWEVMFGTNPLVDDSLDDPDADFLVNFEEYREGTDPHNRDTDGDGFVDGEEVMKGYDPLDPDNHPPIPPSPSVQFGISTVMGLILTFIALGLFTGLITRKRLKR